uniref:Uncharacterized protein n=1 Tax=Glossina palpalis gambiensis TaxID=67801 RepID=A0A1B0BCR0_9MUSC
MDYDQNTNYKRRAAENDDLNRYDLIVMDMPWRNKYIKRLKTVKQSLSYDMLRNEELKSMPIEQLTHSKTLVAF